MRFFYAKKEQVCKYCKGNILYGDDAVIIRWKPHGGIVIIPLVFHAECYSEWVINSFNQRYNDWKLGSSPRPIRRKRGRKFLYKNKEQAKIIHQLKALRRYHEKSRNLEAVRILNIKIKEATDACV